LESHRVVSGAGAAGLEVLVKREDLSADGYGGNKVRPLEMVFGAMESQGLGELWSTGAYGSNHALAAVIHARRLGLQSGAVLWPQPWSTTAQDNLVVTASLADRLELVRSVAHMVPRALWVRRTRNAWVMPPGAATPLGALGHAGAALELAYQLEERGAEIDTIVLPVGSTCTTVGLLLGTALAHGIGVLPTMPTIAAVRVTPWPVTDANRIAWMAVRSAWLLRRHFEEAGLKPVSIAGATGEIANDFKSFRRRIEIVGDELGPGYGVPTVDAWRALSEFLHCGIRLDTTYSAKAAAHLLKRVKRVNRVEPRAERVVFWATKSSVSLPDVDPTRLAGLPHALRSWLRVSGVKGAD
jgi:1-aminocyclopropane-1-carboxylate deaminase/D-cysteine desulfhydrase-like pyridoxal-dependent ACC family enzyme